MKKILLGVAASVLCAAAAAEERSALMEFLHGTYNGGAFGRTTVGHSCQDGAHICNDPNEVSFKVYGGLRLTDTLGQEFGFISFGRNRSVVQPPGLAAPVVEQLTPRTNGFVLNFAPSYPITATTSIIARFGLGRWHIVGDQGSTHIHESRTAPYLGAAFKYRATAFVPDALMPMFKGLGVEFAWDATRTKYANAEHWFNMFSLGTSLEF